MKRQRKPGIYEIDEIERTPRSAGSVLAKAMPSVDLQDLDTDSQTLVAIPRTRQKARSSRSQKAYCYRCGSPWPTDAIACPACRSTDKSFGEARPVVSTPDNSVRFPFPWDLLPWPKQGTACIVGGPGSGKSSLCLLLGPSLYLSREMEPKVIGSIARRVRPDLEVPKIVMVETADDVEIALRDVTKGPIILDSATALETPKDALRAAKIVDSWAKKHDERAAVIIQINKSGESAGFMQIPHLFDTVVELDPDPWGVRALRVPKSRWTSTGARYWTFDEKGQIGRPRFDAAYSVEGKPGEYWLHPYPLTGAKWTGVLRFLESTQTLAGGCASAAIGASYMDSGFVCPPDISERKRFALENGLLWIDPDDLLGATGSKGKVPTVEEEDDEGDDEEVKPKRGRKKGRRVKMGGT